MAVKSSTPPLGMTTVVVGLAGRLVAGPKTDAGVVVLHMGVISAAVGAAGLPGSCAAGAPSRDPGQSATTRVSATTSAAATIAVTAFCPFPASRVKERCPPRP